ncbi:MAG TPA: response regulator [Verrucomicrobiae bacterium]|nr:response regulator [Verrucomicrobiae bacterium]
MPRLLLIEDNQHIQRIFRERLQREGFQVFTADDGEQGWKNAQELRPDLILLDIMLPKMDGLQVLKQIHEDPGLANIPVFMLSNRGTSNDVQLARALGARHFFTKGSSALHDVVWHIRNACGFKKVLICTRPDTAAPLIAELEHPRVLCSIVTVFADAIGTAERGSPDVVVLDARPSRINTITLLQHLKSNSATRTLPVIVIHESGQTIHRADAVVDEAHIATELRPAVTKYLKLEETENATADVSQPATTSA